MAEMTLREGEKRWKKKSGKYRLILNLKGLNQHIEKRHLKMDTLWSAVRLMTPNCFVASINLTDAYYLVPIAEEHCKYLRFYWQGCLYQYTCMPNGLSSAPRCFTKLLKTSCCCCCCCCCFFYCFCDCDSDRDC